MPENTDQKISRYGVLAIRYFLPSRFKLWSSHNYFSMKIEIPDESSDTENISSSPDIDDIAVDENEIDNIEYVVGDVTQPKNIGGKESIVVHCVGENHFLWELF